MRQLVFLLPAGFFARVDALTAKTGKPHYCRNGTVWRVYTPDGRILDDEDDSFVAHLNGAR